MNTKPCNFEQELLFSLHGMGSVWERMKTRWHCMFCLECRRRRSEFAAASRALMTLRPNSMALSPTIPGFRRSRLIICSAAIAIAAAVLSYYLSVRADPSLSPSIAQSGSNGVAGDRCTPSVSKGVRTTRILKPDPRKLKPKRPPGDETLITR